MSRSVPWTIAAVAAAAALGVLVARGSGGHRVVHPEARPGVTAERVLPPSLVLNPSNAAEAYAAARQAPQLLDALYCHCDCARNFGHRSLLTCFESDHGSQCDICMGEALLATRLAERGNSLEQIRHAIDERFGS
ncbi:MAG TPA: CYCXC family (seleno)protein [Gemmatimonadales bacterium]|nr:CYCXC family (seleno)protein [Gemmatimonadales bacterium]